MTKHRRYQLAAVLLVLVSAMVRLPLESAITSDFRQQELLPEKLDTSVREKMTQQTFAASAGGMRSLIASAYELDAFGYFLLDPPRWDMIDKQYSICCQLQPRVWQYWDMHTWMLAVNAANYYATEGGAVRGAEGLMQQFYRDQGLSVCYRGIQHNPEKYRGYRQAADILVNPNPTVNPNPDFAEAAELYLQASKCADAQRPPAYPTRMLYRSHLYCLARLPHRMAEAYPKLRTLFESGSQEDLPTTRTLLRKMEETLRIPLPERCLFK